ncbi:MAG: ribonuclease R [Candidatus Binatia bacterium]
MTEQLSLDDALVLLEQRAPRPLSIVEIARLLGAAHYRPKTLKAALESQVAARRLRRIGKTRYQWVPDTKRAAAPPPASAQRGGHRRPASAPVEGHFARTRAGAGFVEVLGRAADRFPRDIFIPPGAEGPALHGDRVLVDIERRDPRTRRFVGRVRTVTDAVHAKAIGTLVWDRRGWRLVPENALLPEMELVGKTLPKRNQAGQVALVRVTRPPAATRPPAGELEQVLGAGDDPEVQFLTIALEHGLRLDFPPAALAESARLPGDPSPADCAGREDLRQLPFVTIDGESARDFDDAVCVARHGHDGYRLLVAIADVSHYVTPGSALDAEAACRGTSVYFPDRAVSMLPAQLSNELCSLNPHRDRLAVTVDMLYDRAGQRTSARCYRAVIDSRARLTYTQVAAVLSEARTAEIDAWRSQLHDLLPQLRRMLTLMRALLRKRLAAGSLDLDLPEALIDLSDEGRSIGVRRFPRNDAHRIVEEFMLAANCAVAELLGEHGVPFPYRIHEPPDPADIDELNGFLRVFGFAVRYHGAVRPRDVQALLDELTAHPLARVLSRLILRSLKQAQYSTANAGHFGLAFATYCHFTSPIRRYPDLLVHRQLCRVLDERLDAARADPAALEAASVQSSQREREAMEAERAMLDLKKAEFMLAHLHEPGAGTIVAVLPFGFFVELDAYPIEGLVRADAMSDERYAYIERERALKGLRTGQRYRLGDRVVVQATNVSLRRREIDFAVVERIGAAPADTARRRGGATRTVRPHHRAQAPRPRRQRGGRPRRG